MRQVGGAVGVAIFGMLVAGDVATSVRGIQHVVICAVLSVLAADVSGIGIGHPEQDVA